MIRRSYICNQVLQIYREMESIMFPLEPCSIINLMENCRVLTYQKLANITNCSVDDVVTACESKSGCTHYDVSHDRYLILWNDDSSGNNVLGRRRWTKAHELGHIVLKHFSYVSDPILGENSFNELSVPDLETEADQFAATLLCPFPIIKMLGITSPCGIQNVFGLSAEASENRWRDYQKWLHHRTKSAWENDMKKIVGQKGVFKSA